jgi:hypothetical protein
MFIAQACDITCHGADRAMLGLMLLHLQGRRRRHRQRLRRAGGDLDGDARTCRAPAWR